MMTIFIVGCVLNAKFNKYFIAIMQTGIINKYQSVTDLHVILDAST